MRTEPALEPSLGFGRAVRLAAPHRFRSRTTPEQVAELKKLRRRETLQRTMDHSKPGSVVPKAARGAVVVREVS